MAYDFEKHQSVHKYTTKANYFLELHKYVYFVNGGMYQYDWPNYDRIMGNRNSDAAYDVYRKEIKIVQKRVDDWSTIVSKMVQDFIDHHKQNKTGLNVVGIKKSFNDFSTIGESHYYSDMSKSIRIIKIMFKSEEARYKFAEHISKLGYCEAIHNFTEAPRCGKKDMIPMG